MEKIAICITTRNRHSVLDFSLAEWKKYKPKNSKIFIVDDASNIPVKNSNFRFDKQQGIAKAKNKCLELAEDFDFVF